MPYTLRRLLASALFSLAAVAEAAESNHDAANTSTPSEQAVAKKVDAVLTRFATSNDLAIRALATIGGMEEHADGTWWLHESVPATELVEQARGSTDPLALAVLTMRCWAHAAPCDPLDLATRLTVADTQNQVAWLELAAVRQQRGDADGARAAFVRASRGSVWHRFAGDAVRRMAARLPADLSPVERSTVLGVIEAKAALTGLGTLSTVGNQCRDSALREACLRIVETMVRDGDDLAVLTVAAPYAARAGADPTIVARYRQKSDALHWAARDAYGSTITTPLADDSPAVSASLDRVDAQMVVGERRWLEDYLRAKGIDEGEAARRFVATLTAEQLRMRTASAP